MSRTPSVTMLRRPGSGPARWFSAARSSIAAASAVASRTRPIGLDRGQAVEAFGVLVTLILEKGLRAPHPELFLRPGLLVRPLALEAHQWNPVTAGVRDARHAQPRDCPPV